MVSESTTERREAKTVPDLEYCSKEYVVCSVCGHVSRKPGAICPYCSNYLFVSARDDER